MQVLKEYKPLYLTDFYQADCWGGRSGGRSYSLTQNALFNLLTNPNFRGFFVRQVHSTVYTSMWQDLKDRVVEYEDINNVSLADIIELSDSSKGENTAVNKLTGASITTKGFKTSSTSQTANLKSLAGATHIYIDECEEVEEQPFNKLKISLRKKGVKIQILRGFNPPYAGHWIWKQYDLKEVKEHELIDIVLKSTNRDRKTIESIVKANNRTYFKAELKDKYEKQGYLSINTNFVNNFDNLNDRVFVEFDNYLINDFHYYCVQLMGLIPNDNGDVVFNDYDRDKLHTDRVVEKNDSLHIGIDFNVTNMSAVVHVVDNGVFKAVDEFSKVYDTNEICKLIDKKYKGHKITMYPDASGQNRKSNGLSDVDIIKNFGWTVKAPKKNGPVRDRINMTNSKFRQGKYLVNKYACPNLVDSFEKLKYKKGEPDKTSGYDHLTDAATYFIVESEPKGIKIRSSGYGT